MNMMLFVKLGNFGLKFFVIPYKEWETKNVSKSEAETILIVW